MAFRDNDSKALGGGKSFSSSEGSAYEELREEEGDGRGFEGTSGIFEADKGLRRRSSSEPRFRTEEYLLCLWGDNFVEPVDSCHSHAR